MSGPSLVRTPTHSTPWKQIPDGLRRLWSACLSDQKGSDVARALTINFVVVAAIEDRDLLQEANERLLRRAPCRAFVLLLDPKAEQATAELSATTRCHGDLRDIVLETITIRLRPDALEQMPGLVRPLLVNDLPNHLYWATAWPTRATDFEVMAELCDHTIVDSRRFQAPPSDLQSIADRRQHRQRITDLSWLRLRPWRRALAESIDRIAWQQGCKLNGSIRHGRAGTAGTILLADWLEERLGAHLILDSSGDAAVLGPDAVTLQAGDARIELALRGQQIACHVTTEAHCFLPFAVTAAKSSEGDLLATAIEQS